MEAKPVSDESTVRAGERPTVWILVAALSIGGTERTIVELLSGLDRERYDVVVWTIFDSNPIVDQLPEDATVRTLGVQAVTSEESYVVERAESPVGYVRAPAQFIAAVRRERPDIVHSFLFYENVIARLAGLVADETSVVTGERGFHNRSRPVLKAVDRLTLPLSDLIVSNSQAGVDYYAHRGVSRHRLHVVPNGRDLERYGDGAGDGIRDEFGLSPSAAVVGTVGRLTEQKGYFELLHAWERVCESRHDAQLLLVGHGPKRDALEALAADLGIADQVQFTGPRDDVPDLLAAMDVFVFPSHGEGLPGALLEAMAAGLPIVATEVTGNVELLADRETGILVPPRDPAALAEATKRLLDDEETGATLGANARTEAFDRYSLKAMVDRFERVYDECARASQEATG